MRVILALCVVLLGVSACSKQTPPLKSPCVGAEESPCGARRSINDHWMS